jgi:hypothetical protein
MSEFCSIYDIKWFNSIPWCAGQWVMDGKYCAVSKILLGIGKITRYTPYDEIQLIFTKFLESLPSKEQDIINEIMVFNDTFYDQTKAEDLAWKHLDIWLKYRV